MKKLFAILLPLVPLMATAQLAPVGSAVFHWNELPVKKEVWRESRKIVEGSTAEFEFFEVHASTQLKGAPPRPAHTQQNIEELIIIKEGSMKCTIGAKTAVLHKGSVLLVPPLQSQTFENAGNGPLTYYVFQFRSKKPMDTARSNKAGSTLLLQYDSLPYTENATKGTRKFFDRPTAMTDNFEMHITYLKQKGLSHAPHQHVDTEIILIIDGETEMTVNDKRFTATAGDLYIMESGSMHGIMNTSDKPCSYYAFKWR
jgi:mannose-6-phosphate isomerase-like protein (cupin superfamily)